MLLPRIFTAEGVGRALRFASFDRPFSWMRALRASIGQGTDRDRLLDGCVRRFLRGGTTEDLRFFVHLHDLIAPSEAEAAAHRRDYLRLLPSAPAQVADLALRQVRRLDGHEPDDLIEAVDGLLFRAEAAPVKAALTWLDEIVRRTPELADDLAPALATAFQHTSHAVRDRAARLAVKHAERFGPLGAEAIREAVPLLPPGLGALVAAAFGGEPAIEAEPPFTPLPLPAPTPIPAFPAVPSTPAEMADLSGRAGDAPEGERWLAGFVRLVTLDRQGLRHVLRQKSGFGHPELFGKRRWHYVDHWRAALAMELITPGCDPGPPFVQRYDEGESRAFRVWILPDEPDEPDKHAARDEAVDAEPYETPAPGSRDRVTEQVMDDDDQRSGEQRPLFASTLTLSATVDTDPQDGEHDLDAAVGEAPAKRGRVYAGVSNHPVVSEPPREAPRDRLPDRREVSGPSLFVLRRWAEVLAALKAGELPPVLLATPTAANGTLDPDVLVARLAECEAAGREPLPVDLAQALLRLPRGTHPEAAAKAARLTSQAARTTAEWLTSGGLTDPETGVRWAYFDDGGKHYYDERPARHVAEVRLDPVLRAWPTGHDLIDELLIEPRGWRHDEDEGCMNWWPAVLPSHRDVVAVNLLPHLLYEWNRRGVGPHDARALTMADGPAGAATALVLACFLARPDATEGVSLFAEMAARGGLPALEIGRQLGLLIRCFGSKQQHVMAALDAAARAGAHPEVWQVLRALLSSLLPAAGERPRTGLADLVEFAVTVADWAAACGEIPEVAAVAARNSTSHLTAQCRRLHDLLTRP